MDSSQVPHHSVLLFEIQGIARLPPPDQSSEDPGAFPKSEYYQSQR